MSTEEMFNTRNREIGTLLARARVEQHRNISECSTIIGTSRQRYRKIEQGQVAVTLVELEMLMDYLRIPRHEVWPSVLVDADVRQIIVQTQHGKTVVVDV